MVDDASIDAIPGWFLPLDRSLFRWFLTEQNRCGQHGGVAELGAYLGKSAVLIGSFVRPGETFTVIDLFDTAAPSAANQAENDATYSGLTQATFEANYTTVHDRLPTVIRGFSDSIGQHVGASSQRFVHIDASHVYEHVRDDIRAVEKVLADQGIVVFDDMRSPHTFGVAAAVWQEVTTASLVPLVITENKLYATWSDPTTWLDRLRGWLPDSPHGWEEQEVAGHQMMRLWDPPPPPAVEPEPSPRRQRLTRLTPPAAMPAIDRIYHRVKR